MANQPRYSGWGLVPVRTFFSKHIIHKATFPPISATKSLPWGIPLSSPHKNAVRE